ncbi:MAG: iron-binding protein [Betaproteobacteria bacterium]|nr:iron-binding protein [Betaproteobacteria bacterium]
MAIEVVAGKDATIHFDAQKCIHSRTCVLSHPDVFVPNVQGEWIHPDAQPVDELMHIAKSCPSGAIRVVRNSALAGAAPTSDAPPVVNTVRVRENGPLAFEAELQIRGVPQASPRATLCRCGQSKSKPFCDGSHTASGFVASGEPATASFAALAVRNGPLKVDGIPNGPLRVAGNLEVVSGTGRTCNKVSETYLCRCGESRNKPYCDGSHKAASFQAD